MKTGLIIPTDPASVAFGNSLVGPPQLRWHPLSKSGSHWLSSKPDDAYMSIADCDVLVIALSRGSIPVMNPRACWAVGIAYALRKSLFVVAEESVTMNELPVVMAMSVAQTLVVGQTEFNAFVETMLV